MDYASLKDVYLLVCYGIVAVGCLTLSVMSFYTNIKNNLSRKVFRPLLAIWSLGFLGFAITNSYMFYGRMLALVNASEAAKFVIVDQWPWLVGNGLKAFAIMGFLITLMCLSNIYDKADVYAKKK
jgi:hypothetical protein